MSQLVPENMKEFREIVCGKDFFVTRDVYRRDFHNGVTGTDVGLRCFYVSCRLLYECCVMNVTEVLETKAFSCHFCDDGAVISCMFRPKSLHNTQHE